MVSNFDFIKDSWSALYQEAVVAERLAFKVPANTARTSRFLMENGVKWIYQNDGAIAPVQSERLIDLLENPSFKTNLGRGLEGRLHFIRKLGNDSTHTNFKITPTDAVTALRGVWAFYLWIFRTYFKNPPQEALFKESLLPKKGKPAAPHPAAAQHEEQLARLNRQLEDERRVSAENEKENERLKAQIAAFKAANQARSKKYDYTEEETREQFIDLLLREAGWDPHAPNTREFPVTGMPDGNGGTTTGKVDYVLWGDDGKPLALVEAKRYKKDPRTGTKQAELYADCLEKMFGQRPVIFLSNGDEHKIWDDARGYPQRPVQGFYGKEGLELTIQRRNTVKDLEAAPIDKAIVEREYQIEAIRRVDKAFMNRRRKALLVMATGAGKTRLSIALVKQMMQAGWVKRTLFLADRTELVKQAKGSFNIHYKEAPLVNLLEDKEDIHSRIVFSTYQTMMNVIDDGGVKDRKRFGVDHFDLVVIDEAHRSVYKKYGVIFDYFDAMLLGLTATPVDYVSRNTYTLFQCEDYEPTFYYPLDEAVAKGYLVPYVKMLVPVEFHQEGIQYDKLSEEEKEDYEERFFDKETDTLPERIEASKLNKKLFNRDSTIKILKHLLDWGHRIEGGDKLGKTIIFAANKDHAYYIKEVFEDNWPHLDKFMAVIECTAEQVGQSIDDFSNPEKLPMIAVSVDMLDTGIDIHQIVNLVFYKVVRSRAKFEQMIGRGTRTCLNLFGPGKHKKDFIIFDFYDNFTFFDMNPKGVEPTAVESLSQKIFKKRFLLSQLLAGHGGHGELHNKLLDQMHHAARRLDLNSVHVRRGKRDIVERFHSRARWDVVTLEDHDDIEAQLAPLVIPEGNDESARRFDLMILRTQVALMENHRDANALAAHLARTVKPLLKRTNVPAVMAQKPLLERITAPGFAQSVTVEWLETIDEQLRELIRFLRDHKANDLIHIDYEDTFGDPVIEEYGGKADPDFDAYREKVERYIRDNSDHMTILKLRTNQPITPLELQELERMLFEHCHVQTLEDFQERMGTREPLGHFIRSITGLDREAVRKAFASLLEKTTFSADQIKFIDSIVEYFFRNGYLKPGQLFREPFTDIHDGGPTRLFPTEDAVNLIKIIDEINGTAVCA